MKSKLLQTISMSVLAVSLSAFGTIAHAGSKTDKNGTIKRIPDQ